MQDAQDKLTKSLLLGCSLAALLVLAYAAYEENFGADWYRHQNEYKRQLLARAATERERQAAERFNVSLKQLYLPGLNRVDRCVTCHVPIDDPCSVAATIINAVGGPATCLMMLQPCMLRLIHLS